MKENYERMLQSSKTKVKKHSLPILWFPISENVWSFEKPGAVQPPSSKFCLFNDSARQAEMEAAPEEEIENAIGELKDFLAEHGGRYNKAGQPRETAEAARAALSAGATKEGIVTGGGGAAANASADGSAQQETGRKSRGAGSQGHKAGEDAEMAEATPAEEPMLESARMKRLTRTRAGEGPGGTQWWVGDGTGAEGATGAAREGKKRERGAEESQKQAEAGGGEAGDVRKRAKVETGGDPEGVKAENRASGAGGAASQPHSQPHSQPPSAGLTEKVAAQRREMKVLQGKSGGAEYAVCALRLFRLTLESAAQNAARGEKELCVKALEEAKAILHRHLGGVSFSNLGLQASRGKNGEKPAEALTDTPIFRQLRITAKFCSKHSKSQEEGGLYALLRPLHARAAGRMLAWVQEFLDGGKEGKATAPPRGDPVKGPSAPTPSKPAAEAGPLPQFKPAQPVVPKYPDVTGVLTPNLTRNKILLLVVNALLPYVEGPAEWPKAVSAGAATEAALYKAHVPRETVHPLSVLYLEKFKDLYSQLAKAGGGGERLCRELLAKGPSACGL